MILIGIKLGNIGSILGEIVYNIETKTLKIENASVILNDPQNYKNYLKEFIQ